MLVNQIKTLKKQVGYVLETRPETRNSDPELVTIVCELFGLQPIEKASSIERCRRWFNQEIKDEHGAITKPAQFLPTDEKVAEQRGMNMDEWRVAMGYKTRAGSWTAPSKYNEPVVTKIPSSSDPRKEYTVTDWGTSITCDCLHFRFRGGCKHTEARVKQIQFILQPSLL